MFLSQFTQVTFEPAARNTERSACAVSGSPLTEHRGAFDQLSCHLRNRAEPTKSGYRRPSGAITLVK